MAKLARKSMTARARTKSAIFGELAESVGVTRKQVAAIFDGMAGLIKKDLTKGPKIFTVPGLMKIKVVQKAAVPARKGINRFTGQEQMFKAKPARRVIRVRPLKALKDMAA